jgi:hypothetical protein
MRLVECVNVAFDANETHALYLREGLPHTAELLRYLALREERGDGLREFGSGSLDLEGVCEEVFTLERGFRLQELYVGTQAMALHQYSGSGTCRAD